MPSPLSGSWCSPSKRSAQSATDAPAATEHPNPAQRTQSPPLEPARRRKPAQRPPIPEPIAQNVTVERYRRQLTEAELIIGALKAELQLRPRADPIVRHLAVYGATTNEQLQAELGVGVDEYNQRIAHLWITTKQIELTEIGGQRAWYLLDPGDPFSDADPDPVAGLVDVRWLATRRPLQLTVDR